MAIDLNTGLPELPEGYEWEVDYFRSSSGYFTVVDRDKLIVSLYKRATFMDVKRRFRKPSKVLDKPRTFVANAAVQGTAPIAVVNAAYTALKKWEKTKAISDLIGVYPPKKLEI